MRDLKISPKQVIHLLISMLGLMVHFLKILAPSLLGSKTIQSWFSLSFCDLHAFSLYVLFLNPIG